MTDIIRRKHFTLSTERSYCAWLRQYCDFVYDIPAHISSEQKLERFLIALAKKDIAASTQNQAFAALPASWVRIWTLLRSATVSPRPSAEITPTVTLEVFSRAVAFSTRCGWRSERTATLRNRVRFGSSVKMRTPRNLRSSPFQAVSRRSGQGGSPVLPLPL